MATPKSPVTTVRIRGPVAPLAEDLKAELLAAGYTPLTVVNKMRSIGYVSRWLETQGLGVEDLTEQRLDEYLMERRERGGQWEISRPALVPLLEFLRRRGLVHPPTGEPAVLTGGEKLLAAFKSYLFKERGLVATTADAYVFYARRLLEREAADGDVRRLDVVAVGRAIRLEATNVSAAAVQYFVVGVRAFLRFCHREGLTDVDLSNAVLSATGRRRSALPRGVARADAAAMLQACDRRTPEGRRNYAVLTVLLRLGLRATELATLTLEDIDWRRAEIIVHGKGRRDERLPMPADVGEALVAYLRHGRRPTQLREVFVSVIGPVKKLGRGAISDIVRRSCERAGVPRVGAHRLRHTLACEMVGAGVPLPEIGQVLRHRDLVSTAIYARVGVAQLRVLARSWPAGPGR
ncbi:MAG TPA: site-specific integrase [Candidatus Dormibacteraeota bacterium]|nr:site-specific integrase [Candidatus Dormibacteraeota bacterium]